MILLTPKSRIKFIWTEFESFVKRLKYQIEKIAAYDAKINNWIYDDEVLSTPRNYDLVVITLKDGSKIHITILEETKFNLSYSRNVLKQKQFLQKLKIWPLSTIEEQLIQQLSYFLPPRFTFAELKTSFNQLSKILQDLNQKIQDIQPE